MFFAAPYFAAAKFNITNTTSNNAVLSAEWRDNIKSIGIIEPTETIDFTIDDEASVIFTATLNNNVVLKSQPLYFTSGTNIQIEIHHNEIMSNYGKTPNTYEPFSSQ